MVNRIYIIRFQEKFQDYSNQTKSPTRFQNPKFQEIPRFHIRF